MKKDLQVSSNISIYFYLLLNLKKKNNFEQLLWARKSHVV